MNENGKRGVRLWTFALLGLASLLTAEGSARADSGPVICTASTFNNGAGYCLTPNYDGSPLPAAETVKNGDVIAVPVPTLPNYPACTFAATDSYPCSGGTVFDRFQVYDVRTGKLETDPQSNAAFYPTMATSPHLPYSFTVFFNDEPQNPTQVALIQNTIVIRDSYLTVYYGQGATPPASSVANCTTDAQGLHCDLYLGSQTFKLLSTGAPSTSVVSIAQAGAGKASIPRHLGDEMVDILPPVATKYGRTWLPFKATANSGSMPAASVQIALSAGAGGAGITLTAGDPVGSVTSLTTGPDGSTSVAYLIVDESASAPIASATVSAAFGGQTATTTWTVNDNQKSLITAYKVAVPNGKFNGRLSATFTPPLTPYVGESLPSWYELEEQNAFGAIVCSSYRSLVLDFLNKERASPNGWLLNGLDYGPATTQGEGHFFVVLWPHSSNFQGMDALIFDPWPCQTPTVYTQLDYSFFSPRGYKNDPGFVPCAEGNHQSPYPNYPNPQPYPASGAGCGQRETLGARLVITLHSPVDALFTGPDGKRAGYLSADASVNDFGDDYQRLDFPEDATGTRGKLMELSETSGMLDVVGLETGTFGMDIEYIQDTGEAHVARFSNVSVTQGETIHFVVDPANQCAAGTRAGGGRVAVSEPCPLDVSDAGVGNAAGGGSSSGSSGGCSEAPGGGVGGTGALIGLALAALGSIASRRVKARRALDSR